MEIFNSNLNTFSTFLQYVIHKNYEKYPIYVKQTLGAAYKRFFISDKCEGNWILKVWVRLIIGCGILRYIFFNGSENPYDKTKILGSVGVGGD